MAGRNKRTAEACLRGLARRESLLHELIFDWPFELFHDPRDDDEPASEADLAGNE